MKKISQHLGEIIVALACVALLISAIALFKAPVGDFFDNIIAKEASVGNKVLDGIDNTDISGLFANGEGGGDADVEIV